MSPRGGRAPGRIGDAEQAHIKHLLLSIGWTVYTIGTRRRKGSSCPRCRTFVPEHQGTMQTPGMSDLLAFSPIRDGRRRGLFVESKAGSGRLSEDQAAFKALCELAGFDHVHGDQNAVIAWLLHEGYIREHQVPHYRLPGAPVTAAPVSSRRRRVPAVAPDVPL